METHTIVIVGAGFGGLRTALELAKRKVRLKAFEIVLVDPRPEHLYTPLLYEVASGDLELPSDASAAELEEGTSMRYDAIRNLAKNKRIRLVRASVRSVDASERTVGLSTGETLAYDDLVIAVGVETATHGIPGADTLAMPMKTLEDALAIREKLFGILRACKGSAEKRLSVVVVGGGASGTEFASETTNYFDRLVGTGVLSRAQFDMTIVEAGPDVLSQFSEPVRRCARGRLERLGIDVVAGAKTKAVEADAVVLVRADGTEERRKADVVVWIAGVRPLAAMGAWNLPVDERGYLRTMPTFLVEGTKNIYALGDCASFAHPKTKKRVPALAQAAVKEAGIVAENITRNLERKLPMSWTPPDRWVTAVPMGGSYAIVDFGWFHVSGVLGFFVRKLADLQYFASILSFGSAWKLWSSGARTYRKNN